MLSFDKKFRSDPENFKNLIRKDSILIFDLDGTIANTEPYHWIAHQKVLLEFGINLTDDDIKKYIGHNDTQIYSMIQKDYNQYLDIDKCTKNKIQYFLDLHSENHITPYQEITEIILRNNNNYLITNQQEQIIDVLLKDWALQDQFLKIFSLSYSNKTKLETFYELALSKEKVIWFEDSDSTINKIK